MKILAFDVSEGPQLKLWHIAQYISERYMCKCSTHEIKIIVKYV